MEAIDGQGCGGVQGHIDLTHKGTLIMLGQENHLSDLGRATTQWIDLPMLFSGER